MNIFTDYKLKHRCKQFLSFILYKLRNEFFSGLKSIFNREEYKTMNIYMKMRDFKLIFYVST